MSARCPLRVINIYILITEHNLVYVMSKYQTGFEEIEQWVKTQKEYEKQHQCFKRKEEKK